MVQFVTWYLHQRLLGIGSRCFASHFEQGCYTLRPHARVLTRPKERVRLAGPSRTIGKNAGGESRHDTLCSQDALTSEHVFLGRRRRKHPAAPSANNHGEIRRCSLALDPCTLRYDLGLAQPVPVVVADRCWLSRKPAIGFVPMSNQTKACSSS